MRRDFPTNGDVAVFPLSYKAGNDLVIQRSDLNWTALDLISNAFYLPVYLPWESRWWRETRSKIQRTIQRKTELLFNYAFSCKLTYFWAADVIQK